jgi:hypothetical protein
MNSRSKKYFDKRKTNDGEKKGSATKAGYNEQNEKTVKQPNKNPAPSKVQDEPAADISKQDDTAGPNNSGERSDEN